MQTRNDPRPDLQRVATGEILAYFAGLLIIANFVTPSGALAQLPLSYFLKDALKLEPSQAALFGLVVAVPLYGAFVFGMLRDRWSPFNLGDRGFFLVFAPIAAVAYVFLAYRHGTYGEVLFGFIVVMLVYRLIGPAVAGLTASVGQRLSMTGRLSSIVQFVGNVIGAGISLLSGWVQLHFSYTAVLFGLAGMSIVLFLVGLARPAAIYEPFEQGLRPKRRLFEDLTTLVEHRPLWPAVLIWLTWAFGPGQGTPLFYQLTKVVKLNPEQVALYNAIGTVAFIPGLVAYGFLCQRFSPRKLLFVAAAIAVPQMIPLTYISAPGNAYAASLFTGLVGGMAYASFYDLLLRSCPKGLEGTTVEIGITGAVLADKFGNWFGSILYERGGFALCNWITTAAYAMILPMILLVPRATIAETDS